MAMSDSDQVDPPPPPPETLDFQQSLEKTRLDVWSLLHHAVSAANKDIKANRPDLIAKALPGLRKPQSELTEVEIANLFEAYNELSQLAYPATVESLWLKEEIEKDERQEIKGNGGEPPWYLRPWCFLRKIWGGVQGDITRPPAGEQVKNNTWNLKWLLYSFGVVIILLQGYNLFLAHGLETVEKQKMALEAVGKEIASAKAGALANRQDPALDKFPLKDLLEKKQEILQSLNEHYCALRRTAIGWSWVYSRAGIDCGAGPLAESTEIQAEATKLVAEAEDKQAKATSQLAQATEETAKKFNQADKNLTEAAKQQTETAAKQGEAAKQLENAAKQQSEAAKQQGEAIKLQLEIIKAAGVSLDSRATATRDTFFAGAAGVQKILNYLLLPTLLGSLGALAFVIRELLKNYAEASNVIGHRRNRTMRIALGPLLGLVSGIIAYPSRDALTQASFSPLVFGFLVGYSVEFAFSLFDTLIAKGKELLPDIIVAPKQATTGGSTSPQPQVFKLDPAQGQAGQPITLIGSGFSKDAKVSFGTVLANIDKVEDTSIQATVPAGQGSVNVSVQTPNGTSLSSPESQYTYVAEAGGEPEDEEDTHACDSGVHADADAETADEDLPPAQGGTEPQRSA
jgi:hypothetical protein